MSKESNVLRERRKIVFADDMEREIARKCLFCLEDKSVSDFYKHPLGRGGYEPDCKDCSKKKRHGHKRPLRDWNGNIVSLGDNEKQCSTCLKIKNLDGFFKHSQNTDGYEGVCKSCVKERPAVKNRLALTSEQMRKNNLKRRGITVEKYNEILESQGYGCTICGDTCGGKSLHVDHDHTCCNGSTLCGKCFRALLCSQCNTALGLLKEDVFILESMINYINKNRSLING